MTTFLGVPILLRGVAYGNLYLTEKAGGEDFTEDDQELVELLARQAAVAIENARLYEASTRWSRQLESLIEVGNALATRDRRRRACSSSWRRGCASCSRRGWSPSLLPAGPRTLRIVTAAGERRRRLVGETMSRAPTRRAARVLERRRSERVDSLIDDPEVNREVTRAHRRARRALGAAARRTAGRSASSTAYDKLGATDARFTDDDVRLAETFAVARGGRGRAVASASSATRCGGSSRRRSSSGGGSRASCTTRPARR